MVQLPGPQAADAVPSLDTAMASVQAQLAQAQVRRGTRLSCVVAEPWVRYCVVPWKSELATPNARRTLAQHCFVQAYGEPARSWVVRLDTHQHGRSALACALDDQLLDRLTTTAREQGLRLVSVQPLLMHAFNRERDQLVARDFWFVVPATQRLTALLVREGVPQHVRSWPADEEPLDDALAREWFSLGLEGERCRVHLAAAQEALE